MIYVCSFTESLEEKIDGKIFIKSKEELDRVIAREETNSRIEMKPDFLKEYFNEASLGEYVEMAKMVNKNVTIDLKDHVGKSLNTDRFWANKVLNIESPVELGRHLICDPSGTLLGLQNLATTYKKQSEASLNVSRSISELQNKVYEKAKAYEDLKMNYDIEVGNKQVAVDKITELVNTINFQKGIGIDMQKIYKQSDHNYDKVLYIKEDTRVKHVDTLVYYLKEILRVIYGMPTRLLVIEPYYALNSVRMYPQLKPHYAITEGDVIREDILMLGIQPKLFENILKNSSKVSFLIILDRSQLNNYTLMADKVEYMRTASDVRDVPVNFPKERIISYGDLNSQFIPEIQGYSDMDSSKRMKLYSEFTITKNIIAMLEGSYAKQKEEI